MSEPAAGARALLVAALLGASLATGPARAQQPNGAGAPAAGGSAAGEPPAPEVGEPRPARPADPPEALFAKGADALAAGEYNAAIDTFEALADRGFAHPDASFDRGLAYVMRVRAKADRPGDLGRAAAAFEETLRMRPGDDEADAALDLVRAEVTRRRSRRAKDDIDVRPTLDRVIVGLASERTWGLAALCASLLLAVGMVLRSRSGRRVHVAGSVLAPSALVALVALAPLAWGARELRLSRRAGVVIVQEVRLTDDQGIALGGDPLPEAAAVELGERRGASIRVRWGATEGWAPVGAVRWIAP